VVLWVERGVGAQQEEGVSGVMGGAGMSGGLIPVWLLARLLWIMSVVRCPSSNLCP